jgi:MFS family permease
MAAEAAATPDVEVRRLPRNFWTFFAATTVSSLGDGMLVVGLPLLAASLTRSPMWIAVVVFAQRLAQLLLALPAGALVDRLDPRMVAIASNVAQAALMGVAGLLIAAGHFPLAGLLVLAFLTEGLAAVFNSASGVLVATVVPNSLLGVANMRLRSSMIVSAYVAGPGLGGLVFATGRQLPVLIDGASFVLAAGVLAALRLPRPEPKAGPAAERHFVAEIKEGVRISFGHPALRLAALILAVVAGFQAASVAVIVLLGTVDLHLGKTAFGLALACGNVVAPATLVFLPRIGRMKTSTAAALGIGIGALGEVVIGTATSAPQLSIGLALDATAVTITSTALLTARMRLVPREVLGRMVGGFTTVIVGAQTLGTLFGGVIARVDLRSPYLTCAAAYVVLLAVVFRKLPALNAGTSSAAPGTAVAPGSSAADAAPKATIPEPTPPGDEVGAGATEAAPETASAP